MRGSEKSRMWSHSTEAVGIFVMHFALENSFSPGAVFGGGEMMPVFRQSLRKERRVLKDL